jgi:hypothetical protein
MRPPIMCAVGVVELLVVRSRDTRLPAGVRERPARGCCYHAISVGCVRCVHHIGSHHPPDRPRVSAVPSADHHRMIITCGGSAGRPHPIASGTSAQDGALAHCNARPAAARTDDGDTRTSPRSTAFLPAGELCLYPDRCSCQQWWSSQIFRATSWTAVTSSVT